MNDPEDRPTASDRPPYGQTEYGGPPEQPRVPASAGGPPGDPGREPVDPPPPSSEPDATWEDVVDPQPVDPQPVASPDDWPQPGRIARASAASSSAPTRTARPTRERDDDYPDDYGEYEDAPASRWVSLLATIGTALIAIVTVQVLTSLVEGLTIQSGQRVGVPDDFFHRLGYPFGGLGATALVFLVLGVVLVALPSVLGELLSEGQDRVVGIALLVAIVMGVLIAIGSLLAVRANLHEYAAKNVAVPNYVRVQFTNFLLGSLGAAALTLFAAIASINERRREIID